MRARGASLVSGPVRYPGEDFFREHNPRIRQAEEDWEREATICIHCGQLPEAHKTVMMWCDAATTYKASKP